jgi:hypothetical protein
MNKNIRKCFGTGVLSLVLLLAARVPALAKNSRTIVLSQDAVVSGKTLPAGEYVVQWQAHSPQANVEFAQGRKVVLSAEGRFEDRGKKFNSTTVLYDSDSNGSKIISEIRFAGSSEVLVFSQ